MLSAGPPAGGVHQPSSGAIDLALAVLLAVAGLLPNGLTYLGFAPLSYVEALIPLLVLLWLVTRCHVVPSQDPRPHLPLWPWHLTLGAVAGSMVLSLLIEQRVDSPAFLPNLRDALPALFRPMDQVTHPFYPVRVALTFVEGWLVFLLTADLCRRAPDPSRRARVALTGWLAGVALASTFAVVQYFTRFALHPYWLKANPNIVRSHSTLEDPNALGAYLVVAIVLSIALLVAWGKRRATSGILLLLAGAGLLTTMSRAALGAAVFAPAVVLAFVSLPNGRSLRAVTIGARIVVGALAVIAAGSLMLRGITSERTRTQPSNPVALVAGTLDPRESADWVFRRRLSWWQAAGAMVRDRPLTGVGLGRFPREMAQYGGGPIRENTHNLFLQFFAEGGLPAGLAFATLIFTWGLTLHRWVRETDPGLPKAIALGGLIATTALAVTLMTGHWLLLPSGQILWSSLLALVATLAEPVKAAALTPRRSRVWLAVAGVVLMATWYPLLAATRGVPSRTDPWGYSWGLHAGERTGAGEPFRWTGAAAILDFVLPDGAEGIELAMAAPAPIRRGEAVRVRLVYGDSTQDLTFDSGDIQRVRVVSRTGRVTVRIEVRPVLVPSRDDASSTDARELGVQLLQPLVVRSTPDPGR